MRLTNVDNGASCASAWHLYIASRDGDGDSNYGDDERRELDDEALCVSARHSHIALRDCDDDKASCASAQRHIASHNGDNDISYASAQYHHIILRRVKATTTTTISDNE
jgi:hypothetical protein